MCSLFSIKYVDCLMPSQPGLQAQIWKFLNSTKFVQFCSYIFPYLPTLIQVKIMHVYLYLLTHYIVSS